MCQNWYKSRHLQKVILPVLLLLAVMSTGDICTAEEDRPTEVQQDFSQPIRVRIFSLRDITTQQAKDYLQSAQIADTVLAIPGTNAISVTGSPQQLVHASTVIKLVDANGMFDIQFLDIAPNKVLPAAEKIEEQLGREYSVGSLMEGPAAGADIKAIACTFMDKLLIITPQEQTNKITETVVNSLVDKQTEAEPNQQSLVQMTEVQPAGQSQPPAVSANDVDSTSSPQVVFTEEPLVVEPNKGEPASPIAITAEPNEPNTVKLASRRSGGHPIAETEDDMLGDFLTELTEAAKAEKAEKEAEKIKTEPNQPGEIAAEPNVQQLQPEIAEQEPDKQVEQPEIAEAKIQEQPPAEPQPVMSQAEQEPDKQVEQPEIAAAKIQEQPPAEPQPVVSQAEQVLEEQAPEGRAEEEQPGEEDADITIAEIEEKEPAVPVLEIPNGDEMLELNLPEKVEVIALIDLVGKYLNLNYLYDAGKVTGSVTIKVQGRLKVRELYDLLESVLKFRGFVMSRKGKLVTIVPTAEALDQDPTFSEGIKPGDVVITKVFHLQYITTAAAKALLGGMKLGTNTTEIPESGTLVITEYAFRMQRIEDLLAIVDVPGPPKEFKLRVLDYTLAESLVPKIKTLAEQLGTVNITVGITTPAPAPARERGRRRVTQPQPPAESTRKTAVYIDFDKRTNRILMIGLASEITAVEQIIDSLDVPQQDLRAVREYEIQYVDIDKIVEALQEFGIVESTGVPRAPAARTAGGKAAPAPQPAAAGIISLDQPQIVKLETTNSLLVNATPEQHIQISRIISYIDREPIQAAIPYRIYRLENQEPEALAEVLNGLIEKTVRDKEGKIQQTVKYTEESIAIVPDKNTFSLIVYASRKNQEWIGNLIESLDRRRPQVLIDVSLVEITRDDAFAYDLDVIGNAKQLATQNIVATATAIGSLPTAASVPQSTVLEGGYFNSTGQIKGFYNEGRVQALLTAMDQKKYGRVLARPKVLVNDNEMGLISTEDTTYIAQTTDATLPGTTTTTDTVRVSTSYTPYTAKISLEITPQISEGDLLRLVIKMVREDFGTTSGATGGPKDKKVSNIDTIVTVPDGSTIILGGLTKLNQTKDGYKVPLLGDVPIVGSLFRKVDNTDKANKLYIFVKADILRPEETAGLRQLEAISRANQTEFEKAEDAFQKKEDFPGVKPTPVEPEKVLEPVRNEEPEKLELLTKK